MGTSSSRQYGESRSRVSPWIKWLMFVFNMIFWIVGLLLIAVGIWAYTLTREITIRTAAAQSEKSIFDFFFDFSLMFIVFGVLVFVLSFLGLLGALRENICLLKTFAIALGVLFIVEFGIAITVLILSSQAKAGLQSILKEEAIIDYRDADINRRNVIDWFQETFECCGVGDEGYRSWKANRYFNCTALGFEKCSVPYSCCKPEYRYKYDRNVAYTRCGHGMLSDKISINEARSVIYVNGCVDAAIEKAKDNILIVGGITLTIVIPQLFGIGLAWKLATQVQDQKDKWTG